MLRPDELRVRVKQIDAIRPDRCSDLLHATLTEVGLPLLANGANALALGLE